MLATLLLFGVLALCAGVYNVLKYEYLAPASRDRA